MSLLNACLAVASVLFWGLAVGLYLRREILGSLRSGWRRLRGF